ncbi:MAG: hypothetical protein IPH07_07335 [Deltaproteobacteria bacterium]|jgi:hypothetical protein|nr:hypothetical protein [Deltaproteobacteria bacterium]MBK8236549.1 hypothetical protein [Deltaproteobacteria bacterium]MBK8717826.1 hypothetical protein [Deltaproteobacteria bacterium]MBP7287812.1 hypothetical protein [Nannocystaceae bacterium]
MRAPWCPTTGLAAVFAVGAAVAVPACKSTKHDQPKFMAAPKSFDPKGGDFTFNEKNLEAFNSMEDDAREAHLAKLIGSPGSFKGQATYQRTEELTDKIDDRKYGQYVIWAKVPDPVWLEVTVEYHLFSDSDLMGPAAADTYIEFTGTLLEMTYLDDAKPRRMEIKVKADAVTKL